MTTKLVVRVLDTEGAMLGSAVHHAAIKGDGCLRAAGPVVCGMARPGVPAVVSLHWCDVNVEVRVSVARRAVVAGQIVEMFPNGAELIRVGDMPVALPPVEVGAAVVAVPVGGVGAR